MNKSWIRKDNKGVSPVIATILMVAITVVLAAVLYLMVSSFTESDTTETVSGTISLEAVSSTEAKIRFGTFSPTQAPLDLTIVINNGTGSGMTSSLYAYDTTNNDFRTISDNANTGTTLIYTTTNYNEVNGGDDVFFTVDPTVSEYEVRILINSNEITSASL